MGLIGTLQDPNLGWNTRNIVSLYFHNSDLQTRWAMQTLSHYSFRGNESVLDFGSGDGKLTALISYRVPNGSATGVDISREMVTFATKMFPPEEFKNLSYVQSGQIDFSDVAVPKFDLITSFCVFHLIPDPATVLANLKTHLKDTGKLVMTFPVGGNPDYFRAASEEMAKRNWSFPEAPSATKALRVPSQAAQFFEDAGFKLEHFELVHTRTPYSSKEELIDWFEGTLTANWNIPEEGRRQFLSTLPTAI